MDLLGIDVSHHQKNIDWAKVGGSGLRFAFTKATEGLRFRDPSFAENWAGARAAGLYRGAYHFGHPGYSPDAQAVFFHSVVGSLESNDLPPVLDLEVADGQSRDHIVEWTLRFVARAEVLFDRPLIIYTGGFWRFQLGDPDVQSLSKRPLWFAAYRTQPPPALKTWPTWTFWQYTDDDPHNPVPGIAGQCDRNRFAGDEAALEMLTKLRLPAIDVAPQPAASTNAPAWPGVYLIFPTLIAFPHTPVKLVQTKLLELGYRTDTTGIYDEVTAGACRAFQRERGLVADGIVGPLSWKALFNT